MHTRQNLWLIAMLLALPATAAPLSESPTREELEAWFNSNDTEKSAASVNEGQLRFLLQPPDKPVHHHANRFVLDAGSLVDGWVQLTQCHDNLDRVAQAQIVFREGHIRDLAITENRNIARAWVQGNTVQLENISSNARLCLTAQSLALHDHGDGHLTLRNGPFMRKFLDGYYPMRVSTQVTLLTDDIRITDIEPPEQPGFRVWKGLGQLELETWFEGRLLTEIHFRRVK